MDFSNFGMNPPDPEQIKQTLFRLKDVFQRAADAPTGDAQPHFERLSRGFSRAVDGVLSAVEQKKSPQSIVLSLAPALIDMQMAQAALEREIDINPAVAPVIQQLVEEVKAESASLMDGMDIDFTIGGNFGALKDIFSRGANPPAEDDLSLIHI